tara:strand:- start:2158 stop:2349 length:192 start_codon:yes stop_codon:yes gene_type:complete
MPQSKLTRPHPKLFGLVRDPNGVPKFDDPSNVPDEIKALLTKEDLRKLPLETVEALGFSPLNL